MVIDTSAIVALLACEPDARRISLAIENAVNRSVPTIVRLEATMVLSSRINRDPEYVACEVDALLREARVVTTVIDEENVWQASMAFARYGKGRGHPARLNLADCLIYAAAKRLDAPLLFIGSDFVHTDIVSVLDNPLPIKA